MAWRAVKGAGFGRSSWPLTGLHATSSSSWGRSATQFSWASSLVEKVRYRSPENINWFASLQVFAEILAGTTHICPASIRTLNGPLVGPRCMLGFALKPRSITEWRTWVVRELPSQKRSSWPSVMTQSPEQGGGCHCRQTFWRLDWFSRLQLMASWTRLPLVMSVFVYAAACRTITLEQA